MSRSVAVELATSLEQAVPRVKAQTTATMGGYVIVASYHDGKKTHPVVIKNTAEFGLLLAFLEQQAERAGRPIAPMRMMEDDKARVPVY